MKGYTSFIIGLFAVVAAVAVGFWIFSSGGGTDSEVENDPVNDSDIETMSQNEEVTEPEISEPMSGILTRDQWSFSEQAEEDISEALEEGQKIDWVLPIEELGMAYFTTTLPQEDDSILLSVFEYNLDDYSFNRIYKRLINESTFSTSTEMISRVRVAAFDAGILYFLMQPSNDSPGPCAEPLLLANESADRQLLSLSVADPLAGWQRVDEIPAELQAQAEARQSACFKENL